MRTVALLRGINVGGHRKVPMAELRALCAELGFTAVKTYIQSGNVAFDHEHSAPGEVLSRGIAERFGFEVPVMTRSREQLIEARDACPYEPDPRLLHVFFLSRSVEQHDLDPERSPGDVFTVDRDRLYALYAKGAGTSKLSLDWFERQLKCSATARTWRTLETLIDL